MRAPKTPSLIMYNAAAPHVTSQRPTYFAYGFDDQCDGTWNKILTLINRALRLRPYLSRPFLREMPAKKEQT